ncbi:MAG: hypothetical protein F4X35_03755 [Alphaproteobacteria bacterium]|nr:hypothetical protein [Alphaproteobacteria bacterium]
MLAAAILLPGCAWFDQDEVERDAASVEDRLSAVGSLGPERPGFRSLMQSKNPYLALRPVTETDARLPEDLLSETGVVVTLGDEPGDEVLARRISDAAGIDVRLVGAEWLGTGEVLSGVEADAEVQSGEQSRDLSGDGRVRAGLVRNGFVSGWLSSWSDELAGDAGVWSGPLDRLLDAWTEAAGYRWRYDDGAGLVEVVRSETRIFEVHALQGEQKYNVTTTTTGAGGEATSGSSSQSISSETTYDTWKEIGPQAAAAAGAEGTVSVSVAAATVTATGLPRAVERVRAYLEHVNRHVLRPVTLSVHLYSVRFDRGSDYEVGLTGILPEAFGSNFVVGVEGGSISVVKPTSVGTSTLRATVNALRKVGTASRVLSVDVPTLNGRPAQFYDLFDEAYLKEIATTISDGVRAVQLTPGTVSSGFGLSFVARIVAPDEVLARITATIQDRPEFAAFGSAGNQIQLPSGGRRAIVVTQRIARGETLLLTGFRDRSSSGSREGTFHPAIPLPEGGADADIARIETALLVTADIGQPLGLSERRIGAGFLPGGPIVQVSNGKAERAGATLDSTISPSRGGARRKAGG